MLPLLTEEPLLVQTCIVGGCAATTFTSFWTTLTFLLSDEHGPYRYSSLVIGLFALIGIAGLSLGPLWSRYVIDAFRTHFSVLIGLIIIFIGTLIGTLVGAPSSGLGGKGVAGPIIQAFFLDFGLQSSQIANRAAIYALQPKKRNRVNTVFMIVGTSVGNSVYARSGWRGSGGVSLGFIGAAAIAWGMRAPGVEKEGEKKRWVGWKGDWGVRKVVEEGDGEVGRGEGEKSGEEGEEKAGKEEGEVKTFGDKDIDLEKGE
ncbi:uncharacterized protein KY384_000748 [Bacidia gigantensis]|uniref:uncharacterized protein n=1 Tax=Bacidia gigantensis TaxID=2732470 RepID=UPI001D0440A6|nr:uncharacterized protein KY384_000748 [Bacidia gigantensis]KAG8525986.1 hypothetical protein KY384_000748 [Bacidia gigantensis]